MRFETLALATLLCACAAQPPATAPASTTAGSDDEVRQQPAPQPKGTLIYALTYVPGATWKDGAPIPEQGLGEHFAYMGQLFEAGVLVANGPYGDEIRGLYLLAVPDEARVREIAAADPAVKNEKLVVDTIEPWFVMMDALASTLTKQDGLFELRYTPGPAWETGKPLAEQALGPHMKYVGGLFADNKLLAGGPVPGKDEGRYIVVAADADAAQAVIAHDPAVKAGLFEVSARPWSAVQRQAIAAR